LTPKSEIDEQNEYQPLDSRSALISPRTQTASCSKRSIFYQDLLVDPKKMHGPHVLFSPPLNLSNTYDDSMAPKLVLLDPVVEDPDLEQIQAVLVPRP
jgi:hypothetical protein